MTHELDLEAVVGRFYVSLYRFALSLTKNEAEAGDLTPHVEFRPEIHDAPSIGPDALRALDAKAVIDALHQIEPTYRTAVELFYLSELSYKEIAQTLDIPIGTVMSRLSRGKEQLKAILAAAISENSDKIIPLKKDEESAH